MALTLEQMAVQFSSTGDALVIAAFKNIGDASDTARKKLTGNFEATGASSEKLAKKLEHTGTQAAFALAALAASGDASLKGLAHSLAGLGFLFGTTAGAITLAVVAIGEAIYDMVTKSKQKLDELAAKAEETAEAMRRTGDFAGIRTQQRLYAGDIEELNAKLAEQKTALATAKAAYDALAETHSKRSPVVRHARDDYLALKDAVNQTTAEIATAQKNLDTFGKAAINIREQPADKSQLPVVTTAAAPKAPEKVTYDDFIKANADKLNQLDAMEKAFIKKNTTDQDKANKERIDRANAVMDETNAVMIRGMEQAAQNAEKFRKDEAAKADAFVAQFSITVQEQASLLGDAITEGFKSAFSGGGISGFLQGFGDVILGGLGAILKRMGEAMIAQGLVMIKLLPFLMNIFTSGPALVAAGAALIPLGGPIPSIADG